MPCTRKRANTCFEVGARGDDCSAIADSPEVLGGIEAVRRRGRSTGIPQRAVGLRGVLDDHQVGCRKRRWIAIEVDEDDRLGPRCAPGFDSLGCDAGGVWVDINGSWDRADRGNRGRCWYRGEGGSNTSSPGGDPSRRKCQLQALRRQMTLHAMTDSQPFGKFGLERGQFSTKKEFATGCDSLGCFRELRGKPLSAPTQIDDRYHG